MQEYAGTPGSLVGDVDCTADGKALCETHAIRGFPTIKYGDPDDLQDYNGARSYEALAEFAKDNLKPPKEKNALDQIILKVKKAVKPVLRPLQEDVEHIMQFRKNAAVLLVVVSFLLGVLLTRCICPRRVVVSSEKKSD